MKLSELRHHDHITSIPEGDVYEVFNNFVGDDPDRLYIDHKKKRERIYLDTLLDDQGHLIGFRRSKVGDYR